MSSITSAATGNWAAGATWVGGVPPGNGDTAIIDDPHTVTIAAGTAVTVGDAANPTTPAIQTAVAGNGTGVLIVDNNATLNVKGYVIQGNATWQLNGGAALNFDHATANLRWQIGDGNSQANSKLVLNGSSGSRVIVTSTGAANASGFGQKDGIGWTNGGRIEATFASFSKIGTSSIPLWVHQGSMTTSMAAFFDDCLFSNCGRIDCTNNYWLAGATFRLRRCTFRTPLDGSERSLFFLVGNGAQTGLVFDQVRMKGQMYLGAQGTTTTGVSWSDVVLAASTVPPLNCTANPPAGTADLVMMYNTATSTGNASDIMNGTITRLLSMRTGNSVNPHAFQITVRQNTTINGGIWEFGADAEAGDQMQVVNNPAGVTTLDISNVIAPPSPGTLGAGTLVNISHAGSSGNNRISVQQCTSYFSNVANAAGCILTENTTGGAGVFTAIRNNVFWRATSGSAWAVYDFSSSVDNGTFTNADYNCRYNSTDDGYQPADAKFTSPSPPGTNDITTNPDFFDSSRDFLSWGQSINGSLTTIDQVMDEVFKVNDDSGFDPAFTLAAYYDWVRAGFAPKTTSFATAGSSGGRIGAVDVYIPPFAAAGTNTATGTAGLSTTPNTDFFVGEGMLGEDMLGAGSLPAGGAVLAAAGGNISTGSANLTNAIRLAAAGTAQATGTAALTTAIPIAAAGLNVTSGAAALTAAIQLALAGLMQASGTGGLSTHIPLAGAGAASATGGAALSTGIPLAGAGTNVATGSADLTTSPGGFAATGLVVNSGTAQLSTGIPLAGAGAANVTANGSMTTAIILSANGLVAALGSALLDSSIRLNAAGQIVSSGSAGLSTQILMAAVGQALASSTASITVQIQLAGNGAALATGSADLTANGVGFAAAGTVVAAATANLSTGIPLTGAGASLGTGTAALNTAIRIAGVGSNVATGSAALTSAIPLQGVGVAAGNGNGTLTVSIRLTAAALAQAIGAGGLTTIIQMQAAGVVQAAGAGLLTGYLYVPTPRERTLRLAPESRALRVPAERRAWRIPPENRTYTRAHHA